MRRFSGIGLSLALLVGAVACASAGAGAGADDGEVGIQPRETAETREAGRLLAQAYIAGDEQSTALYEQALSASLEAITADPQNPKAHLLAGQAQIGLGNFVAADTLLERAESLYPGYADEIAAEREQGWVAAYNEGVTALSAGDAQAAIEAFTEAGEFYDRRPESFYVLGSLLLQENEPERAVEAFRRVVEVVRAADVSAVDSATLADWRQREEAAAYNAAQTLSSQLGRHGEAAELMGSYAEAHPDDLTARAVYAEFLSRAGRTEEAEQIYSELLGREDLAAETYYLIGVGFFNAGDYARAADAFRRSARVNPYDRGTQFNLVQALYSQAVDLEEDGITGDERQQIEALYTQMLEAADRVREADPLNRNLLSFMIRANRGLSEVRTGSAAQAAQQRVRELLQMHERMAVELADVNMARTDDGVQLTGSLQNFNLSGGTPVGLRFTVVSRTGQQLGSETVTVPAPPQGQARAFQASISLPAGAEPGGWRYERVQ